jgi:type I restriction enzyme S subunit
MATEWKKCKLGDIINLKRGYDLPQRDRIDGDVPIVTSSGITGYHNVAKAKGPGVVTGRYGTLGEIFYVKEDYWPHNTALYVQDFKGNDPLFISYLLRTLHFSAQNVAGAVPGVNRNYLHILPVTIPPLPVQRKIADMLSAYDDLIEVNARRIRVLEAMAQSVYRERFGKVDGRETERLSNLVETQYGYTETASKTEIGPKFVRGMDINKNSFIQWHEVPYCRIDDDELPKYKLSKGDIMVIRMADPGKVGIVEKDINAVFASYLIRLRIKSQKLSPYYLFYFLLSDRYKDYVTGASTGTTRKSASAGVMTDIDIVIPPDDVREKFEEQITTIREMLNVLLDQNANLRRTRDLLLPRLVSGEADSGEFGDEL